jgi:hypothetical protein
MKAPSTTLVLLIVIALAYLWVTGRFGQAIGAIK